MPRNYAATAPGGHPATTRGTSVPGPGDDVADALLKASQARLNTERFSPEHMASYAAWAGITDRRTALDLHRAGVTADDVNAYTKAGVSETDYRRMSRLMTSGVTPAAFSSWRALAAHHSLSLSDEALADYVTAEVTPDQVTPYLTPTGTRRDGTPAHLPFRSNAKAVTSLIAAGISARRAAYYAATGITSAAHMVTLTTFGCRPKVVTAYRHTLAVTDRRRFRETDFVRYYTRVHRATGARVDLDHAIVTNGISAEQAADWVATGAPAHRVDLYLKAGITPTEYTTDPTIADADEATLATFAALRGHRVTLDRSLLVPA